MSAHAGRLRPGERFVFGLVFTVMAGFVGGVTITAARSDVHLHGGQPVSAAGAAVPQGMGADTAGGQRAASSSATRRGRDVTPRPTASTAYPAVRSALLAGALAPLLARDQGRLAVGVIDVSSGATASYEPGLQFRSAGIAAADIMAVLLLQHQQSGQPLRPGTAGLVSDMIESGSSAATAQVWQLVGGSSGVAAANKTLRLDQTMPGSPGSWLAGTTTVADQLHLLSDLSLAGSPLDASARTYALGLMAAAGPGQRWGVPAAASGGTTMAVTAGLVQVGQLWAAASIGAVERSGHMLLVVVLSGHNQSRQEGIDTVQAAAAAAGAAVMAGP